MKTTPWMMLVSMMAGWMNRQQQEAIEYHPYRQDKLILETLSDMRKEHKRFDLII